MGTWQGGHRHPFCNLKSFLGFGDVALGLERLSFGNRHLGAVMGTGMLDEAVMVGPPIMGTEPIFPSPFPGDPPAPITFTQGLPRVPGHLQLLHPPQILGLRCR